MRGEPGLVVALAFLVCERHGPTCYGRLQLYEQLLRVDIMNLRRSGAPIDEKRAYEPGTRQKERREILHVSRGQRSWNVHSQTCRSRRRSCGAHHLGGKVPFCHIHGLWLERGSLESRSQRKRDVRLVGLGLPMRVPTRRLLLVRDFVIEHMYLITLARSQNMYARWAKLCTSVHTDSRELRYSKSSGLLTGLWL